MQLSSSYAPETNIIVKLECVCKKHYVSNYILAHTKCQSWEETQNWQNSSDLFCCFFFKKLVRCIYSSAPISSRSFKALAQLGYGSAKILKAMHIWNFKKILQIWKVANVLKCLSLERGIIWININNISPRVYEDIYTLIGITLTKLIWLFSKVNQAIYSPSPISSLAQTVFKVSCSKKA